MDLNIRNMDITPVCSDEKAKADPVIKLELIAHILSKKR